MTPEPIDDLDRRLIVATQAGLPRVREPYAAVAAAVGITPAEVIERLRRLLDRGVIRRIGVVPNHYAIGWTANGMSVWDVDDDRVDAIGERVGRLDFVSHSYRRPRSLPDWPYNLFAMVHGRSRDEVHVKVATIAGLIGDACRGHDVLFSTRILKKTGLRLAD